MKETKRALIWRFLRPYAWIFALTLLFSVCNTVLGSLTPQVVRVAVDCVLGGEPFPEVVTLLVPGLTQAEPMTQLFAAAGFLLLVAVFSGLCTYGSRMTTAKGSESFVKSMRDGLYQHIQRLPYAWHVQHSTGEIIQRCTSDVEVVRNFVTNQLLEVFRIVFLVAFSLAVMFSAAAMASRARRIFTCFSACSRKEARKDSMVWPMYCRYISSFRPCCARRYSKSRIIESI